jgi:HAMP domain-containing protein
VNLPGAVLLLIGAVLQDPAAAPAPRFPVQLGASISPDTVTVGQQFTVVIRARAPLGATVTMPLEVDSAVASSPTATALVGKPVSQVSSDSSGVLASAAYRFAAWDVGLQVLGLPDIVVVSGVDTGYVSLGSRAVFVRSVLPADTTLHDPKPPRPALASGSFDWKPVLLAALALVAALLLWRLWVWFRRRSSRVFDPFSRAQREFARIEALGLIAAGEAGRHAAMMSDVLREYLAGRIEEIDRSQTSSELLANAGRVHVAAPALGELLWRTDLIKFAASDVTADESERLAASAKSIVRSVESAMLDAEQAKAA